MMSRCIRNEPRASQHLVGAPSGAAGLAPPPRLLMVLAVGIREVSGDLYLSQCVAHSVSQIAPLWEAKHMAGGDDLSLASDKLRAPKDHPVAPPAMDSI